MTDLVKTSGYFLIVDMDGEQYRLPEKYFAAIDTDGLELDPTRMNRSDRVVLKSREGDWDIIHVSVSESGIETVHRAYNATFLDRAGFRIEHEYEDGEMAMFRRDPSDEVR